ncbi:MAG: hypothetical protein AAF182_01680 [Pseudomonadota bacterium]
MILYQYRGEASDRDTFVKGIEDLQLSGEDKKYINKAQKRVAILGTELVDNKVKYAPDAKGSFLFRVEQNEIDERITVLWQDFTNATGDRLNRLKNKFNNAVALSDEGRDALRNFRKKMLIGDLENSEESISKGSAGVGFVEMALKSEKMSGRFEPDENGQTKFSIRFEL